MNQLVNFNINLFPGSWFKNEAALVDFVEKHGLDGIEVNLYEETNNIAKLKSTSIGYHLPFHPYFFLLLGEESALLDYCGDWKTVASLFGVMNYDELVAMYRWHFTLAEQLNVDYVVFHPVVCDHKGIYSRNFPWSINESLDICASLLNHSLSDCSFSKKLLFENLWWEQSFTLETRWQYDYLRTNVHYQNCGICLDTGHMMATNQSLNTQKQGVEWLMTKILDLDISKEIHTIHLNSNINRNNSHQQYSENRYPKNSDFWTRFNCDLEHISRIDPHLPFRCPEVSALIDLVEPKNLVHELRQTSFIQWQRYLEIQKRTLLINKKRAA